MAKDPKNTGLMKDIEYLFYELVFNWKLLSIIISNICDTLFKVLSTKYCILSIYYSYIFCKSKICKEKNDYLFYNLFFKTKIFWHRYKKMDFILNPFRDL
jgi:hypothetical protein